MTSREARWSDFLEANGLQALRESLTAQNVSSIASLTRLRPADLEALNLKPIQRKKLIAVYGELCSGSTTVVVSNGDFEVQPVSQIFDTRGYDYVEIESWEGMGNTVLIRQCNAPWGSLNSGVGRHYLGLQNAGASIRQRVAGLLPTAEYTLGFKAASRPGYPAPSLFVKVCDADTEEELGCLNLKNQDLPSRFSNTSLSLTASGASITITFVNISELGDRTVFVDAVTLTRVNTDVEKEGEGAAAQTPAVDSGTLLDVVINGGSNTSRSRIGNPLAARCSSGRATGRGAFRVRSSGSISSGCRTSERSCGKWLEGWSRG